MKLRKSVFVVAYSGEEYLLLKRKRHWVGWEFPKGGIKIFESRKNAIKRELKEEAGVEVIKGSIKNHRHKGEFLYEDKKKNNFKHDGQKFVLYSAEVKKKKINLKKNPDQEHSDAKWVSYKKALKMLTWPNQKKCLKIVYNSINGKA